MQRDEILKLLEQVGAIRTGHFELSSGRHSATYIQCALVLQHPQHAEQLGRALAERFKDHTVACVVSPALGGLIIGHEVARALGVRSLFVERDRSGQMALRRGFELKPGEHVLVIEDVWSWNVLLRPVVKLRRKSSEGSDLDDVNPILNTGLKAIITAERYLPVKSLPGVTLFLRARRP